MAPPSSLSESEQLNILRKLEVFKIQGTDKSGRPLLRIIGKLFPGNVSVDTLKKYLQDEIIAILDGRRFSVVYIHTAAKKEENFPGLSYLKCIYDAVPVKVRENMETCYFLHPGLKCRLFLATFGRFLLTGGGGVYEKVKYLNRLEFLWESVRRKGIEIPKFVYEFDEQMEYRPPTMESDHRRFIYTTAALLDSPFSTRPIA